MAETKKWVDLGVLEQVKLSVGQTNLTQVRDWFLKFAPIKIKMKSFIFSVAWSHCECPVDMWLLSGTVQSFFKSEARTQNLLPARQAELNRLNADR